MMRLLFALLLSFSAHAEDLTVSGLLLHARPGSPSCGLLKHREIEREKVLRELVELQRQSARGQAQALLLTNTLLINRFFLDRSVWADESVLVQFVVTIPDALHAEIERVGLDHIFLSLHGPGFTWQSYAGQVPEDLALVYMSEFRTLHVSYPIYQSELCFGALRTPEVAWIDRDTIDTSPEPIENSFELVATLLGKMDK
ncbi:MAG: hypothetical protein KF799_13495 [Bdellovibrionales bacterium]|nr:hypothetical protein [Bdellovibrionales bacterium]